MPGSLVGVNTLVPNRLVRRCAEAGVIAELAGYEQIRAEVRSGDHTRFDLMLSSGDSQYCWVEIKNCTLVESQTGFFPDAKTERGRNHLIELQRQVTQGSRCVMFFLVQRMDAKKFMPADEIDPAYGTELRKAHENGVEIVVYDVDIDLAGIRLGDPLPWQL